MENTQRLKGKLAKKTSTIMRKVSSLSPFRALVRHRRAVNAVVSNIILIAAVLIVGFTTLFWSQYQSSTYQMQYSNDINSEIGQLQEKVVFEYIGVKDGQLCVYLLNCGKQNVTIQEAFVTRNIQPLSWQRNSSNIQLLPFVGSPVDNILETGEQAYFTMFVPGSGPYLVKIVTGRDSTFVGSS